MSTRNPNDCAADAVTGPMQATTQLLIGVTFPPSNCRRFFTVDELVKVTISIPSSNARTATSAESSAKTVLYAATSVTSAPSRRNPSGNVSRPISDLKTKADFGAKPARSKLVDKTFGSVSVRSQIGDDTALFQRIDCCGTNSGNVATMERPCVHSECIQTFEHLIDPVRAGESDPFVLA